MAPVFYASLVKPMVKCFGDYYGKQQLVTGVWYIAGCENLRET